MPIDATARRLWGVQAVVSTDAARGDRDPLLDGTAVSVDHDGQIDTAGLMRCPTTSPRTTSGAASRAVSASASTGRSVSCRSVPP